MEWTPNMLYNFFFLLFFLQWSNCCIYSLMDKFNPFIVHSLSTDKFNPFIFNFQLQKLKRESWKCFIHLFFIESNLFNMHFIVRYKTSSSTYFCKNFNPGDYHKLIIVPPARCVYFFTPCPFTYPTYETFVFMR